MRFSNLLFVFAILFTRAISAQNMADYTESWEGKIEDSKAFNLKIAIENVGFENATFRIYTSKPILSYGFNAANKSLISVPFTEKLLFEGILSKDGSEINGFITAGFLLYHVKLIQSGAHTYVGDWSPLMLDELKALDFYLSVENGAADSYEAYPVFADNRFTGTWCTDFKKEKDQIYFADAKTGLQFKAKLLANQIQLGIFLGTHLITEVHLRKSTTDWKMGNFNALTSSLPLKLPDLERLIAADSLPNTHSVLIMSRGKMLYENYFDGYNANVPHDMRSASKSISSAIVGLAKDRYLFKSVNQSLFDFLPLRYQSQKDSLKAGITLESLLTMSSGLDAIDYGINANPESPAVEDNYQRATDWTAAVLSAGMIHRPNTKANYGSANPYLLGVAMDSVVPVPLKFFMDEHLFQKLGISNYISFADQKGKPYFGGGMYLTPRDLLKFGQLYLNGGIWGGKRILSKKWVAASYKNYRVLENTVDKNGYGYLWWHHSYQFNGTTIQSIEARGAGGQYIFVLPDLKSVVVVTSGNYRNGKTQQPELIFEKYILPYLQH